MGRNRKYREVKGWWLYSIQVKSNGKYYIGISKCKECWQRWQKKGYEGTALEPYLNEWQDMKKTVLIDGLNKQDAYIYEGKIIEALSMNNLCINERRSGLISISDKNAYHREYMKQYRKDNTEYQEYKKQYNKQYHKQRYENDIEYREHKKQVSKQHRENNKEQINQRRRQRYLKKKLEKQQPQLTLFDIAS